jgi:hypothetical protein
MARTIAQIKSELTTAFMSDTTLQEKYGFAQDAEFETIFSKVSIENILLYIVAAAIWTHEKLFDAHKAEVENIIAQQKPHTLRWYVNKVKLFRAGKTLIEGTDEYDNNGYTAEDIEGFQVVKFAAATETDTTIYIKVATESAGVKQPLSAEQLAGLKAYIKEVKDAGVRVDIINAPACYLTLSMKIYYDPMVLDATGKNISTSAAEETVKNAIKSYIENLPFNGEYSNMALTDVIQQVEGVKIVEITDAEESRTGSANDYTQIDVKTIPYSGYYSFDNTTLNITYRPYES